MDEICGVWLSNVDISPVLTSKQKIAEAMNFLKQKECTLQTLILRQTPIFDLCGFVYVAMIRLMLRRLTNNKRRRKCFA